MPNVCRTGTRISSTENLVEVSANRRTSRDPNMICVLQVEDEYSQAELRRQQEEAKKLRLQVQNRGAYNFLAYSSLSYSNKI